uniref:Arginase n=1 Tax=uncultured bacterium 9F08 TaxID=697051 RepID=D2XIS2_9BACT|nr:arginase [uncultured bacterium 9F08]
MSKTFTLSEVIARLETGQPPLADAGFLGASLSPEQAALVLIPVPWEATTSYGGGTSQAPAAIINASHQLDLEDSLFDRPYRAGIAFTEADPLIARLNADAKPVAASVIEALEQGGHDEEDLALVNAASARVNELIYKQSMTQLEAGKQVALVGGDHSCPEGLLRALAETEQEPFAILHFDAHHDLRQAFEGFSSSHASIFYNVMEGIPAIERLVQVGIRDYCREEKAYAHKLGDRCRVFYSSGLFRRRARGDSFAQITKSILDALPQRVYISFDIDALDPPYCPSTGTPVPGGMSYAEACYIIEELALSGRTVVGFDLCEVSPAADGNEWDANVGARILYKLCGALLHSQGLCRTHSP